MVTDPVGNEPKADSQRKKQGQVSTVGFGGGRLSFAIQRVHSPGDQDQGQNDEKSEARPAEPTSPLGHHSVGEDEEGGGPDHHPEQPSQTTGDGR